MQKGSVKGKKSIHFQNKRTHNLETVGGIHKKNATLLETSLLKNCGKLSSLSPKSGDGYTKKVATIRNRQRIKQESHGVSVGIQMRQEVCCTFQICFQEFLSKIKSFTERHVSETEQKATTILKEGYTSQRRLLLFLVQYRKHLYS